jgi:hypothetical protein
LSCTTTSTPSAGEQISQGLEELARSTKNLSDATAARRSAEAAATAAAISAEARRAALDVQAKYNETAAALKRFAADSVSPDATAVNQGLVFDWSLLDGVESSWEQRGKDGYQWQGLMRWALTDTPNGGSILRGDATIRGFYKQEHVIDLVSRRRVDPAFGGSVSTLEGRPLRETVAPLFRSVVVTGHHAFAARTDGHGFDVTVPLGTIAAGLLPAAIAAIPAELPARFRVWVVSEEGEVMPAEVEVVGRKVVKEPVGQPWSTCDDPHVRKEKREAVTLKVQIGTSPQTMDVLAAAPHLEVGSEFKCRIVRR